MGEAVRDEMLFPVLSEEHIACLADYSREMTVEAGDFLFKEGEPSEAFFIVLEGTIRVTKRVAGEDTLITIHHPGQFTGETALMSGGCSLATGRAVGTCRVLHMTRESFRKMLPACPDAATVIIPAMAQRRPEAMVLVQQREKLAALGKMSAGLAHELNNPAAAAHRAAAQIRETFQEMQPRALRLGKLCLSVEQRDRLIAFQRAAMAQAKTTSTLDTLTRSDREEEFLDWLDERGIEDSYRLAPAFVEAGFDPASLENLTRDIGHEAITEVLNWLESTLTLDGLLRQVEQSANRIADLVKAVKAYSYMDQAPLQEIDLHEGLDSTLTMFAHALKGGIEVKRAYDRDLPRIPAYGSELNQVWTNLIDNAIDAMGGHGTLTIRTALENDRALVEITDDGSGIAPEHLNHIFEPFFTTKQVGKGTGLGLDTSYRIVVNRHHGDIAVISHPGDTRFSVRLPLYSEEKR